MTLVQRLMADLPQALAFDVELQKYTFHRTANRLH